MKMYYAAGLQELTKASDFRGETLKSLKTCSNFKRTHQFLKQSWEAMYTLMIEEFLSAEVSATELAGINLALTNQHECSVCVSATELAGINLALTNQHATTTSHIQNIQVCLSQLQLQERFDKFIQVKSLMDNTWKLWVNFTFRDCHAYMCLHSAIRTANWNLRLSSLKEMTPLFFAYDRDHYQKILPCHFADLLSFPQNIMDCLKSAWTVSLKGNRDHNVALDEAHEMCINKDLKGAVVRLQIPISTRHPCFFLTGYHAIKTCYLSFFQNIQPPSSCQLLQFLLHLLKAVKQKPISFKLFS